MRSLFTAAIFFLCTLHTFAGDDCEADWDYEDDGLTVEFENDSEADEGFIVSYLWEFGDGTTSTEENPTHTYSTSGEFIVCLTVTTNEGCVSTECDDVDVEGAAGGGDCEADFDWDDDDYTITFTDDSDGDGADIINYSWDFGDGTSSTIADPEHTYLTEDLFIVCLTIETADGCASTLCDEVELDVDGTATNCTALFDVTNIIGDATGFIVEFTNTSTNATTYSWDFDDASASDTSSNPMHFYELPGIYTICLTTGSEGTSCFDEYCQEINLVSSSNGINNAGDIQFSVFPNPASEFIQLAFGDELEKSIEILNLYGQVIQSYSASHSISIPVQEISSGNYIIRVQGENNFLYKNIIIQH